MINTQSLNKYPRGSEWRRWDLHIHTPLSIVQRYGGNTDEAWENFNRELEQLPAEVKVIGINDYIFIDGYKKVLDFKNSGRLTNIDLILPVIELRVNEFCGSGDELRKVNVHIIFDQQEHVSADQIQNQFINGLAAEYFLDVTENIEWNMAPTVESIKDLGRMMKEVTPKDKLIHHVTDLQAGFNNLFFTRQKIFDLLERTPFVGKYFIGIGFAEWDQMRWDQAASVRRDLANKANFFFTAGANDEIINRHQQKLRQDNFPQPIIHGSDSHENSNIGRSRTWIKADPTFEGLKQTIYEPEERLYIGDSVPKEKNQAAVIDSVLIRNSNSWFDEETPQVLNDGLVAIVGEKGAGKTALAELIALAAGDFETKGTDPTSFIRKALKSTKQINKTIQNCTVEIIWANGSSDQIVITEDHKNYLSSPKVRYLSQSFIEKKCDPNYSDELQREIENIIFQHIPREERLDTTTFLDMKRQRTKGLDVNKSQNVRILSELSQEIHAIEGEIGSLEGKKHERQKLEEEVKQLEEQKPKPQTIEELSLEETIASLKARRTALTDQIASYRKQITTLDSIATQVAALKSYVQRELKVMKADFDMIGLSDVYENIFLTVPEDLEGKLRRKKEEIVAQIAALQGSGTLDETTKVMLNVRDITKDFIDGLDLATADRIVRDLEAQSSLAEAQRSVIRDFEDKISKNQKRMQELEKNIDEIEHSKKALLPEKIKERESLYKSYVALLQDEKAILEEMYAPLKVVLGKNVAEGNKLEFSARIEFDVETFIHKSKQVLDFRTGRYHRNEELLSKEIRKIADAIELAESADVYGLIDSLHKTFYTLETGDSVEIESQLLKKRTKLDFYNWIFDVSCFKVAYTIRFQETNIDLLSPGKKGIVLLLMYLALDTESTTPLIIDQPEENLDNKSVYAHLIDYFRKAKKRRQIIMITHNPNLVLNTDAEQVIIANFEANPNIYPARITYISGSIENSFVKEAAGIPLREQGIREHGLDILEGGRPAFIKRGKKWNIGI